VRAQQDGVSYNKVGNNRKITHQRAPNSTMHPQDDPTNPRWRPYIFIRDEWMCRFCGERFYYSDYVRRHIAEKHDETLPPSMHEYWKGAQWQRKKNP
jgi:uncharacterized protein DUF629